MQNRNVIKVCLVGKYDNQDIRNFINTLKSKNSSRDFNTLNIEFFNYQDNDIAYQIWDLRHVERIKTLVCAYYKEATAIICFNVNNEDMNLYKKHAPADCQFIVYDSNQTTPENCIQSIELKPNMDLVANVNSKCMLLTSSQIGQDSIFSIIPEEITKGIVKNLIESSFQDNYLSFAFFKSVNNYKHPTFITSKKSNTVGNPKKESNVVDNPQKENNVADNPQDKSKGCNLF